MTVTSIFSNPTSVFSRTRSSPSLPDLTHVDPQQPSSPTPGDLPRAASYTSVPTLADRSYPPDNDRSRGYSTDDVSAIGKSSLLSEKLLGDGQANQTIRDARPKVERMGRRKSLVARPKSWIHKAKGASPERGDETGVPPVPLLKKASQERLKTVSGTLANLARKTWIPSSRSPSPGRRTLKDKEMEESSREEEDLTPASSISSSSPRKRSVIPFMSETPARHSILSPPILPAIVRKGTFMKKPKRPKSDVIGGGDFRPFRFRSANSSAVSLPNASVEALSIPRSSSDIPPLPGKCSTDKLSNLSIESPKKKDELWSVFRSLESDFQKFQTKPSALRTNVVRSTLLPFLRTHAQHPSNKNLRPEDLDRRINVLNKWWTALLEILDGHNNQHVSGMDRPVILEAMTAIMTRPEWRSSPSHFASLSDRSSDHRVLPRSRSSGSLSSSASQFLADSVYHNVRNMFIQNLLSQMSMVVDKMSLRNAPASLVTFCGKAAAYAFFFCPGVADVLLKLWAIPSDTIRRMADELGLARRPSKSSAPDDVVVEFPPHLHALGWRSAKALVTRMHQRTALPLGAARIMWYGPWIARWCGRDSDLFFVFCKHYHILLEEFLPADAPFSDKARAPGFLLVQCQMLTALDTTIHRQPSGDAAVGPGAITFDDVLLGIDASASALPLPPSSNASRLMAENRLIMLLRDFLSERPVEYERSRHTFAAAFSHVMQASALKTSQFDRNACFILCDFIEEALPIYSRFQNCQEEAVDFIDWSFWLNVCRKILENENSLSQIRLFSFIFGAWNLISSNDERKAVLCLEWLLAEDSFLKYYLHWCPMVRAYYMRLLCWRACRYDGEASQLDTKILSAVSDRLKLVWSHYLHLKQTAEQCNMLLPSIAPCHPAPGRRLLIIRNDTQAAAANLMLGFDGIYPKAGDSEADSRRSSMLSLPRAETTDAYDPARKKWSLLDKIMPFNGSVAAMGSVEGPGHVGTSSAYQAKAPSLKSPLELARTATASSKASTFTRASGLKTSKSRSVATPRDAEPGPPTHRAFSFKFSLEWSNIPQIHQAFHMDTGSDARRSWGQGGDGVGRGRERRLNPPRLPAPAHSWLVSQVPGTANEVQARAPTKLYEAQVKYAGRALAEWALIIMECNNFIERRKAEGVPALRFLEVPTLGVEGFKKFT
ncbi:MAG: hypothetical protein M1818_005480 [Claussenomyces sp. TS43310]|nr:MAG: hypothetical protein M1818_005480 [Claussenomyces sp. TS43310]